MSFSYFLLFSSFYFFHLFIHSLFFSFVLSVAAFVRACISVSCLSCSYMTSGGKSVLIQIRKRNRPECHPAEMVFLLPHMEHEEGVRGGVRFMIFFASFLFPVLWTLWSEAYIIYWSWSNTVTSQLWTGFLIITI